MLHFESVEPDTLELLKRLQSDPILSGTRLVGGTALALHFGHRKSVDLDLFGNIKMTGDELEQVLQGYGEVKLVQSSKTVQTYFVRGVKVDFVNYPYDWLTEPVCRDGLTLASPRDIAAMKLEAVTNRGSRKDFVDIAFLLERFALSEILGWYKAKYPRGSEYLVLRSLSYFHDAEEEPMPVMLKPMTWATVKERIQSAVREAGLA